jgi:hypothetical protein
MKLDPPLTPHKWHCSEVGGAFTEAEAREGGRGKWATWEINRERGRVCRDQVERPGEQVAERGGEKAGLPSKH